MEKSIYIKDGNDTLIPNKVRSLSVDRDNILNKEEKKGIDTIYLYEDENGIKHSIASKFISNKDYTVLKEDNEYKNGFRRVLFIDYSYGFREENTGMVLPYKFNLATDFSDEGIAIVALGWGVTLFTSDYRILYKTGQYYKMGAFSSYFSIPFPTKVDMVYSQYVTYTHRVIGGVNILDTSFFNANGEILSFKPLSLEGKVRVIFGIGCDKTILKDNECKFFESGFILCGEFVLFESGYYMTLKELCQLPEIIDNLNAISNLVNSDSSRKGFVMVPKIIDKREGE